jgi:hypothetical protein
MPITAGHGDARHKRGIGNAPNPIRTISTD